MNFYRYARKFLSLKSKRLKVGSLLFAHLTGMRYIGIFLDPVIACNLRCRMCYFSDDKKRPAPKRPMDELAIERIGKALFHRAVKLQIGCGAEPTLYSKLPQLVAAARQARIPHIEITTNGQLLTAQALTELIQSGLTGITLSMHGTTAQTYENLMPPARFCRLQELIHALSAIKKANPKFNIRINYTFNNLNAREMGDIFKLLGDCPIDVLQMRPIQQLGETSYHDFDLNAIYRDYDELIGPIRQQCAERNIICISPEKEDLLKVKTQPSEVDTLIEDLTYYYVAPDSCYKSDFDMQSDTYGSYHRRKHLCRRLLRSLLGKEYITNDKSLSRTTKKLNYTIK